MGISHSEAYAAAGVDIEAGYQGVKMMNRYVQRTLTADVISDLGGFGGLFSLDLHGLEKPVLVSGTDGVGTKQRIAQLMDRHNTVGIDCVAMCVNDIICCGAKPLFFLDYIAIGKNIPEKVVSLVSGVSEGCVRAGCALIGGETAEHPGTMKPDDYDLAGFAVGVVDRGKILDKNKMQPGDVVIETVAAEYLAPLKAEGVDTLVLGCTHYPLLKEVIRNFMGADVTLIDSGAAVAQQLCGYLQEQDLAAEESQVGTCRWYVSDSTENFGSLASRFLGRPVTEPVEQVSLEGE